MPVEDTFSEPLVYEPASGIHKHTIILLHGRGGSADAFGPALLNTTLPITDNEISTPEACAHDPRIDLPTGDGVPVRLSNPGRPTTLAQALPHARFVFPTAPKQRATIYKRSIIRQWFDDWHLGFAADEVDNRYDLGLQTTGLAGTVTYLHGLIAQEAEAVGGTRNIILGGISQGCAVSLVASLLWEGEDRLGGVVGMCGWLPYVSQMKEHLALGVEYDQRTLVAVVTSEEGEADFDPFDRSAPLGRITKPGDGTDARGCSNTARVWLRDEIELPSRGSAASVVPRSRIPAIMCHGRDDEKVKIAKGCESAEFLTALGMGPVRFKEYAGVGHEFSAQMLVDIAEFIRDALDTSSS